MGAKFQLKYTYCISIDFFMFHYTLAHGTKIIKIELLPLLLNLICSMDNDLIEKKRTFSALINY